MKYSSSEIYRTCSKKYSDLHVHTKACRVFNGTKEENEETGGSMATSLKGSVVKLAVLLPGRFISVISEALAI